MSFLTDSGISKSPLPFRVSENECMRDKLRSRDKNVSADIFWSFIYFRRDTRGPEDTKGFLKKKLVPWLHNYRIIGMHGGTLKKN